MLTSFQQDIESMYRFADGCKSLEPLVTELCEVLKRNGEARVGVTYSYRLQATDSGYRYAFALRNGAFTPLTATDATDVTVSGKEANLLAVFQRKLNPMAGVLTRKIKVEGSMPALAKLASFL